MVSISLYRGNLHKVPDVPRRWLIPTSKISLKDFRSLLNRRTKSLSRLATTTTATTSSNPNPNPNLTSEAKEIPLDATTPKWEQEKDAPNREGEGGGGASASAEVKLKDPVKLLDGGDESAAKRTDVADLVAVERREGAEKPEEVVNPNNLEKTDKADELNDKAKRKREVEEKLQVLNARKHNLVQALKQILNVEEELKRRNSMQGMGFRPSVPLQVDVTNDSGSISRQATPRMVSEVNLGGDAEGAEAEDISNHNVQSRHLLRMSSTSPSSESPLRRPPYIQHKGVSHPTRSSLGTTGSPSRFALAGHQGHPANLPTVSVSGTNYVASSPSPAGSGGTSAFRDTRQPSPWN